METRIMWYQVTMTTIWGLCWILVAIPSAGAANCEDWNTTSYFTTATIEDVAECLSAGANPMARQFDGSTPLHLAARYNANPIVAAALIKSEARPNSRDKDGDTPLHFAIAYNANPALITTLLNAGADPNAQNDAGSAPLHLATEVHADNATVITALGCGS